MVDGLPDDDIRIGAWVVGTRRSKTTWYPGTAAEDSAAVITLVDGEEISGIEWQLLP